MIGSCALVHGAFSAGALTLYGLIIDGVGAFVLSGFSIKPINNLGHKIWPPYNEIYSAWDTLDEDGKVSEGDKGFRELAETIGDKEHLDEDNNLKFAESDLKYSFIQYSDEANKPYSSTDKIEVEIEFADHVSETFSLSNTTSMERKLAIDLINQRIENGFLKAGSILLIIGFSLQIYAQLTRVIGTNLITC